jgi:hypothetical protein
MNKNVIILAGAALFLLAFKKKPRRRGSIEIGPLTPVLIKATVGGRLMELNSNGRPVYIFKGGEWLTLIEEKGNSLIVEYIKPGGVKLRGLVSKTDVKYIG